MLAASMVLACGDVSSIWEDDDGGPPDPGTDAPLSTSGATSGSTASTGSLTASSGSGTGSRATSTGATSGESGTGTGATTTGGWVATATSGSASAATSSSSTGTATTTGAAECGDGIIVDGSFEVGAPNPYWIATTSNPNLPIICPNDAAISDCLPGAYLAHSGNWRAFFGANSSSTPTSVVIDTWLLEQTVTIPADAQAVELWLWIRAGPIASDFIRVTIDEHVLTTIEASVAPLYNGWTQVSVDLSQLEPPVADGLAHTLTIEALTTATGTGSDNVGTLFVLDDVEIRCSDPASPDSPSPPLVTAPS